MLHTDDEELFAVAPRPSNSAEWPFSLPVSHAPNAPSDGEDAPEGNPPTRLPAPPSVPETSIDVLTRRYARTQDKSARTALILYHQRLVYYAASRFSGGGETLEDLVQVGNIGLINAIDRFDPSKDIKFSTYALPTIVGEIKRHFRDKTWHVKVPRWLQEMSLNARKTQQSLHSHLGRVPTVRELAHALSASEEDTEEALKIGRIAAAISLDMRLDPHAGEDSATLGDVLGHSDDALGDIDAFSDLRRALDLLNPRESEVIFLRFFEELSQAKIARRLGISQMHVSRLQTRALERLRGLLAEHERRAHRRPATP